METKSGKKVRLNTKQKGKLAELLAEKYLEENGYKIIFKNIKSREWEIDIVAISPENILCIVEVKSLHYGENEKLEERRITTPQEAITPRKIKKIVAGCNYIIQKLRWEGDVRFDVIEIIITPKEQKINHIKEAFYPQEEN